MSGSTSGTVSDKLFSIVCVDCGDPRVLCFGNVGVGGVFCVRKDCGIKSHQGAKSAFAGTGVKLVFFMRNLSSENVFTEPSVPWDQILEDEVRMEWFSASYSLSVALVPKHHPMSWRGQHSDIVRIQHDIGQYHLIRGTLQSQSLLCHDCSEFEPFLASTQQHLSQQVSHTHHADGMINHYCWLLCQQSQR